MSIFKKGNSLELEGTQAPVTIDPRKPQSTDPMWLKKAYKELGQAEVDGSGNNPRIVYYHSFTSLHATQDLVAWCSSFMNFIFGKLGTYSAMARSWITWKHGQKLGLEALVRGCVLIFKSDRGPESGHVTLFLGHAKPGFVWVLGGNQQDKVGVNLWPVTDLLAARWPDSEAANVS